MSSTPRALAQAARKFAATSIVTIPQVAYTGMHVSSSHARRAILQQMTYYRHSHKACRALHVIASQAGGFATVSVQEAAKMLEEGWSYIDVRTPGEFSQGHPPGAVNIPVTQPDSRGGMTINEQFVASVEEAFPEKDTNLLMGCKIGQRSAMASQMLQNQEYINLANVAGGFDHWSGNGMPIER
ncbi:hypothetical protein WJX74_006887 [Apatococcus lobatus]|uniref:Rhodanese domain-containing protein n=1 Tax=Apatococcus lobatus TaxID=904363 RepID=A0AAW1RAR4_9CHLO